MNVEAIRLDHLKSVIVGITNRRRLVADAAIVREKTQTSPEIFSANSFCALASVTFAKSGSLEPGAKRNYADLLKHRRGIGHRRHENKSKSLRSLPP